MIRKGNKTLKMQRKKPLITKGGWLLIYAVFTFSLVFRVFRVTKPNSLSLGEIELFNDFELLAKGEAPLDTKPISGRFLLFVPYYLITKNDAQRLDASLIYLRVISSLLGSLANGFITAAIIINNFSMFSAVTAGTFLCIDGSMIITTKLYTTDSLFLFFVSLVLFCSAVSAKRPNNKIVIQAECFFAAMASCTDQLGFIMVIYVMITCKGNKMKTIGVVLSLLFVFSSAEIGIKTLFSEEIRRSFPDATFADQTVQTIKRMKLLFEIPTNYESLLYWPMIKLRPVELWATEGGRISAVYNIPIVLFVSLSALFGILNTPSWFFWMSLVGVWALKKVSIINYTLVFVFGVLSLVEAFESMHEVIRNMSYIVMLTIAVLFFLLFFPWTYGVIVGDGTYDRDIDLWNR
jgi:dolichyl-phosphate-mannose--protein O-mannosyl transferase